MTPEPRLGVCGNGCGVQPAVMEAWLATVHCSRCGDFCRPATEPEAAAHAEAAEAAELAAPKPLFPYLSDPAGGC